MSTLTLIDLNVTIQKYPLPLTLKVSAVKGIEYAKGLFFKLKIKSRF